MNSARRFFGRTAVFAAVMAIFIIAVGIANLVTGFIGGTAITLLCFVTGAFGFEGARTTWKMRGRVPDNLPPLPSPEVRDRQRRRMTRLALLLWVASVGIGYAVSGVFGLVFFGVLMGITLLIGLRLGDRMAERWRAENPASPGPE